MKIKIIEKINTIGRLINIEIKIGKRSIKKINIDNKDVKLIVKNKAGKVINIQIILNFLDLKSDSKYNRDNPRARNTEACLGSPDIPWNLLPTSTPSQKCLEIKSIPNELKIQSKYPRTRFNININLKRLKKYSK